MVIKEGLTSYPRELGSGGTPGRCKDGWSVRRENCASQKLVSLLTITLGLGKAQKKKSPKRSLRKRDRDRRGAKRSAGRNPRRSPVQGWQPLESPNYWDEYTEDSLTAAGFRREGTTFQKDIVTGSTITSPVIRELREIQQYQDMLYETPDLETASGIRNYGLVYDFDAVQALIANATKVVEAEEERVFGTGVREWRAKGGAWAERDEAPDLTKTSEQKKGWQNKGDGLFGDHVGYAPVYKSGKDLDMDAGRSKNIKYKGSGELGRILGYLSWYNMEEGAGYSQVNLPGYKKPLWDTFEIIPGWEMEAPSLMGVVDMSVSVIAAVVTAPVGGIGGTAISAAINSIDDLVFTAAEVSGGYISPEQGWLNAGKIFAQAGVTVLMDGLMNGWNTWDATDPTKAISGGIFGEIGENFWGKALATFGQQMVTNGANGLINSTNFAFDDNGNITGLETDMEAWGDSVFGENAWAGYASSFVGSAVTAGLNDLMPKLNLQGYEADLDEIGVKKLGILSSTIGGLAGELASMAFDGEFTVNLLNLSDIARIFGAGDEAASRLNKGLFEVGIGWDDDGDFGVRSRFGSGGASLNIGGLIGVWDVFGNVQRKNEEIQARVDAAKERGRELRVRRNGEFEKEEEPDSGLPSLSPENPGKEVTLPEPELLPEIDYEREIKKKDIEELARGRNEGTTEEEQKNSENDAIIAIREYLNEDGQIDSAELFMKDMVLEEGLQAFDFNALVENLFDDDDWTPEDILFIEDKLEDVEELKQKFNTALQDALAEDRDELYKRLSRGDPVFLAYSNKLKEMQELGIINDHKIFNPFDQDFKANKDARNAALDHILDNHLAYSRIMVVKKDNELWYFLFDSRAMVEDEEGKMVPNPGATTDVYRVRPSSDPDSNLPETSHWEAGGKLVADNDTLNGLEVENASDTPFENSNWFTALDVENLELNQVRLAWYSNESFQAIKDNLEMLLTGRTEPESQNEGYNGFDHFMWDLEFGWDIVNEKWHDGPNVNEINDVLDRWEDEENSGPGVIRAMNAHGYDVIRSFTFCNIGSATFAGIYNDFYNTGIGSGNVVNPVSNSLDPVNDTLGRSNHYTEVSFIYGALWGKLYSLSLNRSFKAPGATGHINRISNIIDVTMPGQYDTPEQIAFAEEQRQKYKDQLGYAYEYNGREYIFQFDNVGEWIGADLGYNKAWDPRYSLEQHIGRSNTFVFTPVR
jgi:hypothetical protein